MYKNLPIPFFRRTFNRSTRNMSLWPPAPPPPTKLGRYRTLSPLAGVSVSPFQLGGMSIGDKWGPYGYGEMNKVSELCLSRDVD